MKTAFLCFFPVFPTNMGSAEVIRSASICWPGQKKIFQISHLKIKNNKNLESTKIIKEKPILKLLAIPLVIIKIIKYLKNEKKKIVIIEGPSWIGYSYISLLLLKILIPSAKIIYHSHSIEFEVRKMMSSRLIANISRVLEKYVFNHSDLATAVSEIEKRKIKSLYNVRCIIFENGVSKKILKFNKRKFLKNDYLIYSGSYKYLPNKDAIDYIVDYLMPKINLNHPNLKLVLTGGGYDKKKQFLLNLGIVKKSKLLNLIYNSKMMIVPLIKGTGTRIKIIEGLLIGAKILSTPKGIEGIKLFNKKNEFPIIANRNEFKKIILKFLNKDNHKKNKNEYLLKYSMENIVKNFLDNNHVKEIFKKS
jgi:hypothetical protein